MDSLTLYVAYAFVGTGVYLIARMFFHQEEQRSAKQLLGEESEDRKASNAVIKYSRPFFSRYVVPTVRGMKIDPYRKVLKRKLIAAGMSDEFTPDELFSFKLFLIIGAPLFIGGVNYGGDFGIPLWILPAFSVVGFYYPDLMLSGATKARQRKVMRAMPCIGDLLALSTEAGLDFLGAIGKVVEKARPSPLVEEFDQVLKEIKVGSSRADALQEMAIRLNMQEISSFVAILISADQMGASIGKVLRQQSEQIRTQRFLAGEKEGAKASQKIMMPMFLFILPAIMLTIFGPFGLSMMNSGGPGF
ncbi:MAG: type II secretion system F family protein [Deltaproteobacteria bacterium]|nr:type II secretion system F family protein [Deltaproteobacteria bacterium]